MGIVNYCFIYTNDDYLTYLNLMIIYTLVFY